MSTFCESSCLIANEATICKSRLCLIRHSARGDRVATELLFERVYAAVYRQAQRLCKGGDDAEDLAEETVVLAFEGVAHLKNPQLLLHWMSKIAWNRHLERLRKGEFSAAGSDGDSGNGRSSFVCRPDGPVNHVMLRETAVTLVRAVKALPSSLQQTFRLRVLEQLSTRETAARLGTTESAIGTRLGRARRMLRDSLDQCGTPAGALTTPVLHRAR